MIISRIFSLAFVLMLIPISSFAGRVRTLSTSSQEMPVVHLMTGRSTVIRFSSPPKKVIIGNQNYFNIEFIDSDVTLQPLANTSSNMFVYGDGFTYGFILKVNSNSNYDDLVFIRAKAPPFAAPTAERTPAKPPVIKKDLPFLIVVPKKTKIDLHGVAFKWSESIQSYYADIFLTLKDQKKTATDRVKVFVLNGSTDVTTIKPVFENDHLMPNKKGRVRIFTNVSRQQKLKLKIQINKEEMTFDLKWKK